MRVLFCHRFTIIIIKERRPLNINYAPVRSFPSHGQVQTVSISYLRCLLEHVRCHILDRDIELIYYTIRKSSDVLTRDPMQLGAQLIAWLRPLMEHDEHDESLLSITVRSATAWCDGYTVPLLVPLTGWLPVPLPSQIRTMTVTGTGPIRYIDVAPSKQHLIISPRTGDVQMWHIMNNCLVHTFRGKWMMGIGRV